ncbi:MAG TPA: c-type cytochrome [Terracidiphilus sp.]|jgi:mono/diheme cytochrome c family protein
MTSAEFPTHEHTRRHRLFGALLSITLAALAAMASGQEGPTGDQAPAQRPANYQNMTPEQRAAATRAFLGLGAEPDKAAAARGEPVFQRNCAFCHGQQARGATGPNLITSDQVLGDDHGEKLVPYIRKGVPEKGMPAFGSMAEDKLKDVAEFLHLQVEQVANRGAYQVLNIVVGNPAKGQAFVEAHCSSCHALESFAHFSSKFRSPEQLQRGWIWPRHSGDSSLMPTATVKMPGGETVAGRVTQVSDFRITLVDNLGQPRSIDRIPGVEVKIDDPLAAHQEIIQSLTNDDMHNVTAYLETLK